ncbi:predicted protein [Coccidioides posadasii str. Silveira]|uniref:Predicted protein n=1 Tax=Coccidioides posadasii (strain RMSCC 757 / Silveira) TaxID=443226 RepID=E9D659_COCPS|nr:predicted protein [Coccidioides posadasii str. Silveira]
MIYISGKSKKKVTISLFSGIWGIQNFGKILQTWSRISGFPTRHSTDFTGTKPQNGEVATKVATDTEPTHIELRCLCKCETSKRIETSFHTSLDGKLAVYCHSICFHYLIREIEPGKIDKCRLPNLAYLAFLGPIASSGPMVHADAGNKDDRSGGMVEMTEAVTL